MIFSPESKTDSVVSHDIFLKFLFLLVLWATLYWFSLLRPLMVLLLLVRLISGLPQFFWVTVDFDSFSKVTTLSFDSGLSECVSLSFSSPVLLFCPVCPHGCYLKVVRLYHLQIRISPSWANRLSSWFASTIASMLWLTWFWRGYLQISFHAGDKDYS